MQILFLTSRMPAPPVGGDRFRVHHIIRTAAEAGHRVDLLTFDDGRSGPDAIDSLKRYVSRFEIVDMSKRESWMMAARALPTRMPLQAAYYESKRMRRAFARYLDEASPDVVYTHLFRMAPYALAQQRRLRLDAHWVLDLTDVISGGIERSLPYRRGFQHWLYRLEGTRIARFESRVAPRFDECWVISEAEADALRRLAPGASVRVVPNGFAPERGIFDGARERSRLLFFGNHDVLHNVDAARFLATDILPRVRASIPDATLDIAGKNSDAFASLGRLSGVRVLGFVPDLERELSRAALFVAPHRFAAGVQNKVLQALSTGTPVVTTPVVLQGLAPVPEDIVRVASDASSLAAEIVSLLRNPVEAAALGRRGRAWASERFSWRDSLEAFERFAPAPETATRAPDAARLVAVVA